MREINKEIGKRIRRQRKAMGKSQAELAADIGISRQALSLYEEGARSPNMAVILQLTTVFGVSCDAIVRGIDVNTDVDFLAKKLDRLLQLTMQAKALADEIYDDALIMRVENG